MNESEVIQARAEFLNDLAARAGVKWLDYQLSTFEGWATQRDERACVYYRTGAGKTLTSLVMMKLKGCDDLVVVAPPSTHDSWASQAQRLGMTVDTISHAKFRMKDYKLSRSKPIIVDEFHMLGGHSGQGFKKLDTLAKHLQAPLVICSATPNYNDAERVYCIKHVLDPHGTKGGYIQFLYQHCTTEENPFGREPKVTGFHRYHGDDAAAQFLADLPGVYYLPDELVWTIVDIPVPKDLPDELERYGYNRRDHRMMASQMEERHASVNLRLIDDAGFLDQEVYDVLTDLVGQAGTPVLIFAAHATVATALSMALFQNNVQHGLVDGSLSTKTKAQVIEEFRKGRLDVLVGTASLATGTDGLDKVCDMLIIIDDTDDDALRRQLAGRIMPRGTDTDASKKQVYRICTS